VALDDVTKRNGFLEDHFRPEHAPQRISSVTALLQACMSTRPAAPRRAASEPMMHPA
jgi:hypothetical protein